MWNSITHVIALDSLHDDFEMTTALLLYSGDKDLKEIQQIVTSTKAANMAKRATGQTADQQWWQREIPRIVANSQRAGPPKSALIVEKEVITPKIVAPHQRESPMMKKLLKKPNKLDGPETKQWKRPLPLDQLIKINQTLNLTLQEGLLW